MKFRNDERGETLFSVMIVCAIVAIIAAVATPSFITARKTSVDSSIRSEVSSVATALRQVQINYPNSQQIKYAKTSTGANLYVDLNNNNVADASEPQVKLAKDSRVLIATYPDATGTYSVYGWSSKGYHYKTQNTALKWDGTTGKLKDEPVASSRAGA